MMNFNMFGQLLKKSANELSKEKIAELLNTTPEVLEAF